METKLHDDGSDLGGGLYLVDPDTREAAQAFIEADPFFQAGLFDRVNIVRWRKVWLAGRWCL
ncbi:YciI family protein [Comamonas guangdongensis]|uniref:YciI family protein n=1 Tax=Comamonas guangdongensis TaxID=510515 RepID=UPI003F6DE2B1